MTKINTQKAKDASQKAKDIQTSTKVDIQKDLFFWALDAYKANPKGDHSNPNAFHKDTINGSALWARISPSKHDKVIKIGTTECKGGVFFSRPMSRHLPNQYKSFFPPTKDTDSKPTKNSACQKAILTYHASSGVYKITADASAIMTKADVIKIRQAIVDAIDVASQPNGFQLDVINK